MIALTIMALALAAAGYVCGAIKVGFIVADATEKTGFGLGFYVMTVVGLIALPFAIAAQVFA